MRTPRHPRASIVPIPEDVQAPLRARLRLLRKQHGRGFKDLDSVAASGTMGGYETKDCSTLSLRTLYGLARFYGWSLSQLLLFLAGEDDGSLPRLDDGEQLRRMNIYMRSLPDELARVACEQVAILVDHNARTYGGADLHATHLNSSLRRPPTSPRGRRVS